MGVIVRGGFRTVGYTLTNNKPPKEPDKPDTPDTPDTPGDLLRVGFVIGSDAIIRK